MGSFGCQSPNFIFIIQCSICKKQAIGWVYLRSYDPDSILKDHFCDHHPKISKPGKFISITFIDRYSSEHSGRKWPKKGLFKLMNKNINEIALLSPRI